MARDGAGRKQKKRRNGLKLIAVVVLLLCGVVTYQRVALEREKQALEKRYEELEEKLANARERGTLLEERQIYMQTIPYIKERAREMGLVDPEDILLRPAEGEE